MNTRMNRLLAAAVMVVGLAPLVTFALVMSEERIDAERAFRTALDEASAEYQRTRSLPALKRRYEAQAQEEALRLPRLMREKRALRLQIARLRSSLLAIERRYGISLAGNNAAGVEGGESVGSALRYLRAQESVFGSAATGVPFFRRLLVASLGEVLEEDARMGALRSLLTGMAEVEQSRTHLTELQAQHAAIAAEALRSVARLEEATRGLAATTDQLERIRQTMQEVHEQVLAMQGALARIDARIRARIERELIEKGLLTPGVVDRSAIPATPQFAWPAYGPLSARFLEANYQVRFGIPHYGLDIVLGQGSPVFSVADGVVFLARDGGASGYSYVLVGHRGGYATLYGHLSEITVTTGQDLRQGDAVGLSGGEVGAHGSGPTTTGSHLHFEVIKDGTNLNPQSVLP